ncbi:DUF7547 family protein [Halobellus rarus]|uniref:DUF7547 family protein n=1 Tax=Halobellus rarus TaxID=1126237 RepID=UPI0021111A78|nr:hypothetical protein [Halobellus rarus]
MPTADRDDDLRDLVDELEATLTDLRGELRRNEGGDDGRPEPTRDRGGRQYGSARRSVPERPRPPSLSELFRFTEQYTLPTLIATLEAAIQSLELLRGVLRLADPERSAFDQEARTSRSAATRMTDGVAGVGRDAVTGVGRGAVTGVERALSELQTALSESDLPEDEPASDLLEDARRLSEEVSERLSEASEGRERGRSGPRYPSEARGTAESHSAGDAVASSGSGGIEIEVTDAGTGFGPEDGSSEETSEDTSGSSTGAERVSDDEPEVDVEAELASIKDEVELREARGDSRGGEAADAVDATANGDTDDAREEGDVDVDETGETGDVDADDTGNGEQIDSDEADGVAGEKADLDGGDSGTDAER